VLPAHGRRSIQVTTELSGLPDAPTATSDGPWPDSPTPRTPARSSP